MNFMTFQEKLLKLTGIPPMMHAQILSVAGGLREKDLERFFGDLQNLNDQYNTRQEEANGVLDALESLLAEGEQKVRAGEHAIARNTEEREQAEGAQAAEANLKNS